MYARAGALPPAADSGWRLAAQRRGDGMSALREAPARAYTCRWFYSLASLSGEKCLLLMLCLAAVRHLPEEVVERVAAGMDFGYHLVEIVLKLVYSLLLGG